LEDHQTIDAASSEERGYEQSASLDKQRLNPPRAENAQRFLEAGGPQHVHAARAQLVQRNVIRGSGYHDRWNCVGCSYEGRAQWDSSRPIEDNPERCPTWLAEMADSELWIVAQHGSDSDSDCVYASAHAVHLPTRSFARQPDRTPEAFCDATVD
jgi:hypothetical protein